MSVSREELHGTAAKQQQILWKEWRRTNINLQLVSAHIVIGLRLDTLLHCN